MFVGGSLPQEVQPKYRLHQKWSSALTLLTTTTCHTPTCQTSFMCGCVGIWLTSIHLSFRTVLVPKAEELVADPFVTVEETQARDIF